MANSFLRRARIVHRVPPDWRNVRAMSPDGEYTGVGERGSEKELDRVVQFERFGFVRIDGVVVAYFTHRVCFIFHTL